MQAPTLPMSSASPSALAALSPALLSLFLVYLVLGLSLPVIPLQLAQALHLEPGLLGLVVGCLFVTSVLLRAPAGRVADERGPRQAMRAGTGLALAAGAAYLVSWGCGTHHRAALLAIALGQVLLGAASSFTATGALGWGVARLGADKAGRVMSWAGTVMFLAFALGAPAGSWLWHQQGFGAWALVETLLAGLVALSLRRLPSQAPRQSSARSRVSVLRTVVWPGLGLALASVGFAAVTVFAAALYRAHGWDMGWQAMSVFSASVVLSRLLLGHWPDRFGGARVALAAAGLEALGLVQLGLADSPARAVLGAACAGTGFGLVFPGLGVVAVRLADPQRRGTAMGLYAAFLDLTLGVASPLLGLVSAAHGLGGVFITASACALLAMVAAWGLQRGSAARVMGA